MSYFSDCGTKTDGGNFCKECGEKLTAKPLKTKDIDPKIETPKLEKPSIFAGTPKKLIKCKACGREIIRNTD
jgi:hypothetical protein